MDDVWEERALRDVRAAVMPLVGGDTPDPTALFARLPGYWPPDVARHLDLCALGGGLRRRPPVPWPTRSAVGRARTLT